MIRYEGMKAEENNSGAKFLPVGAYVGKVIDARITGKAPDQQLELALDVSEGPFMNFYMNKFMAAKNRDSQYEVKYKGVLRLRIPNDENKKARYPESDKRRFNDMIYRFEASNEGYHFDGNESSLKGLTVGFSTQEDSFNGATFTRIGRLETADDVRNGACRQMEPRHREGEENPTTAPMVDQRSGMPVVNTEKLPWDENDKPW